jgi:hypothetical protein
MRSPNRDTAVFSTSAIDLFASALGAFILLVMILFPYYRNAGSADSWSEVEDLMLQRRLAQGEIEKLLADNDQAQSELEKLQQLNAGIEQSLSRLRKDLRDAKTQVADVSVPEPVIEEVPEAKPTAVVSGVEFSILGLATEAKSFVIVVDMSGSMMAYSDLMFSSVVDILAPMTAENSFAIIGYQGAPAPYIHTFPRSNRLVQATPENLQQAREFASSLSQRFAGSTPTHQALLAALQFPAEAIILLSDGEPDSSPNSIIRDITGLNRYDRREIHTVALGNYTENRALVLFLQTLARQNNGDFVGVSR